MFPALAVALSLGALLLLSGEAGARGGRRRISNYHEEYRAAAKPYSGVQGGAQFISIGLTQIWRVPHRGWFILLLLRLPTV